MIMCWNKYYIGLQIVLISFVLVNVVAEDDKTYITVSIKGIKGTTTKEDVKIDEVTETISEIPEIKEKKFRNIKVIRINMKNFDENDGVKVKFYLTGSVPESKFLTTIASDGSIFSKLINDKELVCHESTCNNGVVIISSTQINNRNEFSNGINAFYVVFTSNKKFYPLRKINFIEGLNKLIRCPFKNKWMKDNTLLKYDIAPAYSDKVLINNPANHLLVPTQRTKVNESIMECGSLRFKGEIVLTIGYNLQIIGGNIDSKTIKKSLKNNIHFDCIGVTSGVESQYDNIQYIPITSSFDYMQRIFLKKKEFFKDSIALLYTKARVSSLNKKESNEIEPTCVIKHEEPTINYEVEIVNEGLNRKNISLKNLTYTELFEIDISNDKSTEFEKIKNIECVVKQTQGDEIHQDVTEYYSNKYQTYIVKQKYDNNGAIDLNSNYFKKFNNGIKYNNFSMFGLYKCITVDNKYVESLPPNYQGDPKYFIILPKNNANLDVDINEITEEKVREKARCLIDRENFGKLHKITYIGQDGKKNESLLSAIHNSNGNFVKNKNEIVYQKKIEDKSSLVCTYHTDFLIEFTITLKLEHKGDESSSTTSPHIPTSDLTSIIISSVVAVGFIAIAVIVAFILLRRRHRRRKRRGLGKNKKRGKGKGKGNRKDTSKMSLSKSKSNSSSSSFGMSKANFKAKSAVGSVSNTEESIEDPNKESKSSLVGSKETLHLTTK
uniref:EGF-like domain-containing protein n=1 Tax=Parastrongyloides trichosuri TaxID=131310 RepID=A0A0N4Z1A8_PARTI